MWILSRVSACNHEFLRWADTGVGLKMSLLCRCWSYAWRMTVGPHSRGKVKQNHMKVKWSRQRSGVAQRVGRVIALLFHNRGTRRWWVISSTPRSHFTPGKGPVPIYRRLGGPQGQSGRAVNLVPTGIRSRTVQPVVSCYTNWTTRPTKRNHINDTIIGKHSRQLYTVFPFDTHF